MGLDYADDGEGVKPVNVEIRRSPALQLDTRKPIKAALGDSHGLPTNRSNERPEPQKATPVQGTKATPKRANLRNT